MGIWPTLALSSRGRRPSSSWISRSAPRLAPSPWRRPRVGGQIPVGASPHHVLILPNGTAGLVVSQGPGTLELFDPTRHTVSHTVRVGTNPHWIAISTDGRTAYVTNEGSQDVAVVDVASRTVTATVPVGNAPRK